MKNSIKRIMFDINDISNTFKNKEVLENAKKEILEIFKNRILETYEKTEKIYQNKELIILETIEELESIRVSIYDINDKIKCYNKKYDLNNNERLDKYITDILNDNFLKLAKEIITSKQLEQNETNNNLTNEVEKFLYELTSSIIKQGAFKGVTKKDVILSLKEGVYYDLLLNKFEDSQELQNIYILLIPKLSKRLNLINVEVKKKRQSNTIPLIWKVYGVSKFLEKMSKKM